MKQSFHWREGSRISVDAIEAQRVFSKLERSNKLTPETVLEEARCEASPLHEHFEWDDSVAAEKHRLQQAGHLLRSLEVIFERNEQAPIRQYHIIKQKDEVSYVNIKKVMQVPNFRAQVLEQCRNDMSHFISKLERFRDLQHVLETANLLKEQLEQESRKAA